MAIKLKEKVQIDPERLELLDRLYDKIEELKEGEYNLYILDQKPNRSLQQNRYYFGVVLRTLSEHTGESVENLHEVLKFKFNPKVISFSGMEETKVGGSTKDMTTEVFMEYIDKIRQWALDMLDFYIPLPQEVTGQDYSDLYIQAVDLKL
jgi:hypothetical protein